MTNFLRQLWMGTVFWPITSTTTSRKEEKRGALVTLVTLVDISVKIKKSLHHFPSHRWRRGVFAAERPVITQTNVQKGQAGLKNSGKSTR